MSNTNFSSENLRIEELLPDQLRGTAENLISFLDTFYSSQNTDNAPTQLIEFINQNQDLDRVADEKFINALAELIAKNVSQATVTERTFLLKRLVDYYNLKGTKKSIIVFFSLFYNEVVTVNEPWQNVVSLSDSEFVENKFIRIVADSPKRDVYELLGKTITQRSIFGQTVGSGIVRTVTKESYDEEIYTLAFDSGSVRGAFFDKLDIRHGNTSYGKAYRTLESIRIINGGANYQVNDTLYISNIDSKETFYARVSEIGDNGEINNFELIQRGSGNTLNSKKKYIDFKLNGAELDFGVTRNNKILEGAPFNFSSPERNIEFELLFDTLISSAGYNKDNKNTLSSTKSYIQDGNYYSKYSYEINSGVPYKRYQETFNNLVHPAGYKFFSNILFSSADAISFSPGNSLTEVRTLGTSVFQPGGSSGDLDNDIALGVEQINSQLAVQIDSSSPDEIIDFTGVQSVARDNFSNRQSPESLSLIKTKLKHVYPSATIDLDIPEVDSQNYFFEDFATASPIVRKLEITGLDGFVNGFPESTLNGVYEPGVYLSPTIASSNGFAFGTHTKENKNLPKLGKINNKPYWVKEEYNPKQKLSVSVNRANIAHRRGGTGELQVGDDIYQNDYREAILYLHPIRELEYHHWDGDIRQNLPSTIRYYEAGGAYHNALKSFPNFPRDTSYPSVFANDNTPDYLSPNSGYDWWDYIGPSSLWVKFGSGERGFFPGHNQKNISPLYPQNCPSFKVATYWIKPRYMKAQFNTPTAATQFNKVYGPESSAFHRRFIVGWDVFRTSSPRVPILPSSSIFKPADCPQFSNSPIDEYYYTCFFADRDPLAVHLPPYGNKVDGVFPNVGSVTAVPPGGICQGFSAYKAYDKFGNPRFDCPKILNWSPNERRNAIRGTVAEPLIGYGPTYAFATDPYFDPTMGIHSPIWTRPFQGVRPDGRMFGMDSTPVTDQPGENPGAINPYGAAYVTYTGVKRVKATVKGWESPKGTNRLFDRRESNGINFTSPHVTTRGLRDLFALHNSPNGIQSGKLIIGDFSPANARFGAGDFFGPVVASSPNDNSTVGAPFEIETADDKLISFAGFETPFIVGADVKVNSFLFDTVETFDFDCPRQSIIYYDEKWKIKALKVHTIGDGASGDSPAIREVIENKEVWNKTGSLDIPSSYNWKRANSSSPSGSPSFAYKEIAEDSYKTRVR